MFSNWLSKNKALIFTVHQFPQCKHTHCSQFQATDTRTLNAELGSNGYSQLSEPVGAAQHVMGTHPGWPRIIPVYACGPGIIIHDTPHHSLKVLMIGASG